MTTLGNRARLSALPNALRSMPTPLQVSSVMGTSLHQAPGDTSPPAPKTGSFATDFHGPFLRIDLGLKRFNGRKNGKPQFKTGLVATMSKNNLV